MKKLMLMMAGAVALGGVAGADPVTSKTSHGTLTLQSCYGTNAGVKCDFTFNLTDAQTGQLYMIDNYYSAKIASGASAWAKFSVNGGAWQSSVNTAAVNGKIMNVSILYNFPATTTSLTELRLDDTTWNNVPVRPLSAAPAPAPVRPANTTTGTVTTTVNGYAATLTGCKTTGTTITCTSAVLTPRR